MVSLVAEPVEQIWRAANRISVQCRSGSRGKMGALAEGLAGGGYLICDCCGWAKLNFGRDKQAATHSHRIRQSECKGKLRWRSLAHTYETDIMQLRLESLGLSVPQWVSTLYALLEGSANGLEISMSDIDGAMHPRRRR